MTERKKVRLVDGRIGQILRIDTQFPEGDHSLLLWIREDGPGIARVRETAVVGAYDEAPRKRCAGSS